MSAGSYADTGGERKAAAALPLHGIGNIQTAAVGYGARRRAYTGGSSLLWLTAFTFAAVKELQAADPNVIFLDDGRITYKDLEHGSFELITKEPIPRHFLVEDPGVTIVLRAQGSGVSVNQVTNSAARMAELRAAQQDALSTYQKGLGSLGSSSLPFGNPLPVQPINFTGDDSPSSAQDPLPPLPSSAIFVPEINLARPPPPPPPVAPVLNAVTGPIEVDTLAFDTFVPTGGTLVASSNNGGALTYGISGGIAGSTIRNGVTYDVSKTDAYGTLYVNSTTGAYVFVPDSHAINALTSPTTTNFTVTVSDGTLSADQTFTIAINGTNDAAVISGTTAGSAVEAGDGGAGAPAAPTATGTLTNTDVDNPHNAFTAVTSPTASSNGYGTFIMNTAGVWIYTLNEASSAVQALNIGGTLTDTFTVTTVDGSAQTVTVIIHGTNDGAVIFGATGGTATEAGGHEPPTATGTLTNTDVDNPDNAFTAVDSPTASENGFGSFTMTADGVWTYTLNEASSAVQALNVGGTLTDTFKVTTVDGTAQTVTVIIHGTNDGAVIAGATGGSATEAGGHEPPTATGTLTNTDVDNPDNAFTAVTSPTTSENGYGSFTMTADGVWTYTLNEASSAVQALNVGGTLTDTFKVTTVDGTAQTVTVIIHGTNDGAVILGATGGSATEAGGHEPPTATGTLTNTDVDNPDNAFTAIDSPTASENGFGRFTMTADGVWTYTLDDTNFAVQALNVGGTLTDTFTVTTVDGTAQMVTVTIQGTNDAAIISGATGGSATEAGGHEPPTATGTLTNTDVDNPDNAFTAIDSPTASENGFGRFTMTADGVWTYTLDDTNFAVQALNVGGTLTDTFTVTTVDGTAQMVTITIHGTNDAAIISGATGGSATEAGGHEPPTATGTLTNTDVDNPDNAFTAIDSPTASENGFGRFTMTADGVWTYTLDDTNFAVQALNVGGTLTDTFTVTTVDGTAQMVTITIHGTNDAAIISGTTDGCVIEAACHEYGKPTATGTLTDTDVDNTPNTFTPVSSPEASAGGYGSFTMTADGVWSYTLDDTRSAVQALNVGDTLTDTFKVTTIDGTAQTVTVTIKGTNDAAVISGTTSGSLIEAGRRECGDPTATGTLTATDVDNPHNAFTPVCAPETSAHGYGSFTMTADGVWTYTLDNTNCTVQALNSCDTLTDCFTVTTIDGTAQVVTVTIEGTNDAAVISGCTTGSVIEAGRRDCGEPTATGTLTDTDVDNPHDTFTPVCAPETSAGGYGSFTMTANGVWTYTLDNDNCEVQALDSCDTLTDCFKVTTIDGTAQWVTITIQGTNDGHHFNWSGNDDSFQFNDEISGFDGSNFIDPADADFAQAGAQTFEQSLSGQPADDNFRFALEPFANAAAFYAPHDLMV